MHVTAPEGVSTCRSKNVKGEWVEKVCDYVIACSDLKGKISHMKVVKDFESRPHKAVTFLVERGKERQEWNEQKLAKALPGYSGGRLPGRSTEEKGKEGEEGEGSEQRQGKNGIIEEIITSSQRRALEVYYMSESIRTEGQNPIQRWDCSQIENDEEEESWQEGDQMAEQWEKEQHQEDVVERRRMEGICLKLDVIQKVPELVVNERRSQGERVKKTRKKEESARMVC